MSRGGFVETSLCNLPNPNVFCSDGLTLLSGLAPECATAQHGADSSLCCRTHRVLHKHELKLTDETGSTEHTAGRLSARCLAVVAAAERAAVAGKKRSKRCLSWIVGVVTLIGWDDRRWTAGRPGRGGSCVLSKCSSLLRTTGAAATSRPSARGPGPCGSSGLPHSTVSNGGCAARSEEATRVERENCPATNFDFRPAGFGGARLHPAANAPVCALRKKRQQTAIFLKLWGRRTLRAPCLKLNAASSCQCGVPNRRARL